MAAGRVAVLGEWSRVRGFALASVQAVAAQDAEAVRAAWAGLDRDVLVVILTASAAEALGEPARSERLTVVLPP